jgi:5-methylcytosine-specific restriction endonuclease McrA
MTLRTLILTPWMAAHRVSSWQDAVVLAVTHKADTLESYDVVCSSPSVSLQIPAVMRLVKEISASKRGVKFSRVNVYQRDGRKCCYCGLRFHPRDLTYDHVLPRSQGGTTDWLGIVSSCKPCNRRKGNRTPAQAGMRMHFQPYKPRVLPMTAPFLVDLAAMPEQWKPYLGAMLAAG